VQQRGWSLCDNSVGAEAAMATTAEVSCSVGSMVSVMNSVDLLRQILCSYEASQATIETLLWMKRVSKQWPGIVKFMLADSQWMAPLTRSGQNFVDSPHVMNEDHAPGVEIHEIDVSDFLEKTRLHTWDEASQHYGILILSRQIPKTNMAYINNVYYERLLKSSNDAMSTHPHSLRVHTAGVSLQGALFQLDAPSTFSFENFRAADVLTKALVKFGSLIDEIDFVEGMLSNMQHMLDKHKCFAQIFRDTGSREG